MKCPLCVSGFVMGGDCLNCGWSGFPDPEAEADARRRDELFQQSIRDAAASGDPPPRRRNAKTPTWSGSR